MIKQYILLIILLVLPARVLPQAGGRLVPLAPEGNFAQGREYIPLNSQGVELELGFDGVIEDFFVFDLVIVNGTGHPLEVNPGDFYYLLLDNPEADTSLMPPFRAAEPSRILEYYQAGLEHETFHRNLNTLFGCIEAGIGLVSGASAYLATEDPGFIIATLFSTAGTAGHYVQQDRQIGQALDMIAVEQEVIREELMREGVIPPGKVLSGYVFFPAFGEPGLMMFCIPLEDQLFQFVYQQVAEKGS